MLKIGIVGGHLGEKTPNYPYRKWMDNIDEKYHAKILKPIVESLDD